MKTFWLAIIALSLFMAYASAVAETPVQPGSAPSTMLFTDEGVFMSKQEARELAEMVGKVIERNEQLEEKLREAKLKSGCA
jgi:hypothetical protein